MRKSASILALASLVALGACQKTGDGEYKVATPDVDVKTDTTTIRTPDVDVGSKTDTISTPTVGTKPETLIVQKPVVGTKQTEVKTPTVDVNTPSERKNP